jgi:hypothetical protein
MTSGLGQMGLHTAQRCKPGQAALLRYGRAREVHRAGHMVVHEMVRIPCQ